MEMGINENVSLLISFIADSVVSDHNWKFFGFKRRPKRGTFFNRFICESKLKKEQFLTREFIMLSTCDVVSSIKSREGIPEVERLLLITGVISEVFVMCFHAKQFEKSDEFLDYLLKTARDYGLADFSEGFIKRANEYTDISSNKAIIAGGLILSTMNKNQGYLINRSIVMQQIRLEKFGENLLFKPDISESNKFSSHADHLLKLQYL